MKNRSELREIIMKIIYQVNLLSEANLEYDLSDLIKEQLEVKNEFVNTSVDGIIEHKKEIYDLANKYLELFASKSGISKTNIQRWIPIVAATQMTKGKPEEQEFLSQWVDVLDYE